MAQGLSKPRQIFLELLAESLGRRKRGCVPESEISVADWKAVFAIIHFQKVEAFVCEAAEKRLIAWEELFPERSEELLAERKLLRYHTRQQVLANYYLWYETERAVRQLEGKGIRVAVLKGPVTAAFYPQPETRKSGDIDLWIPDIDMEGNAQMDSFGDTFLLAERTVEEMGYHREENCTSNYHVAFQKGDGPEIELHGKLTREMDSRRAEELVRRFQKRAPEHFLEERLFEGMVFPTLSPEDHAVYLLLHMLHHFIGRGFGWKLLCDWTAFWNAGQTDACHKAVLQEVKRSGLLTFTSTLSVICAKFLGLRKKEAIFWLEAAKKPVKKKAVMEMTAELFAAGEFGQDNKNRMVMPKSSSVFSLAREFHFQMRRNHPEQSKYVLLWPALWVETLYVFLKNNHNLRHISTMGILNNARKRSRFMRQMELFQE